MSSITVSIQRTVQVQQYEPLTVTVSQTVNTEGMSTEKIQKLRKRVTKDIREFHSQAVVESLAEARATTDDQVAALQNEYKSKKVTKKAKVLR